MAGGGVAEEELDVDVAGLEFDGPGGEGVAEAVRVDLRDGGLFAQALEDGARGGAAEGTASAGEEEGSWIHSSEVFQVVLHSLAGLVADSDDPLLVPLAMADLDALALEVDVLELEAGRPLCPATGGPDDRLTGARWYGP